MVDPDRETALWKATAAWRSVTTVEDKRAHMSLATFALLADYSRTLPTGVYIAKRWRRRDPDDRSGAWWMGEYAEHPTDSNLASIIWREIWLTDTAPDGTLMRATEEHLRAFAAGKALT